MSYHGPQGKGARRRHRERKRDEAIARNAVTAPARRRAYRLDPTTALLTDIFTAPTEGAA